MSVPLTRSKRPCDGNNTERNGNGKSQKLVGNYSQNQSSNSSPDGLIFRVLIPVSKIDGIIGKYVEIMSQISREAGVNIRVEETVPGSDEKVVVIQTSDNKKETSDSKKENSENPESSVEQSKDDGYEEANMADESNNRKEDACDVDKELDHVDGSEKETSHVQKALLLVFERIVEAELETNGADEENNRSSMILLRLLVLSNQVGWLLGKGGSVIKQISDESGAEIWVLRRDKLPKCESSIDEVVQIQGEVDKVRKALQSISQLLLDNPSKYHESFPANPTRSLHPSANHSFSSQGGSHTAGHWDVADILSATPPLIPKFHESGIPSRLKPSKEILTFHLLCRDERVGGVIGKGGAIIRTLKQETGCDIKVLEAVSGIEDRIIIISGPAINGEFEAVQEALLQKTTRLRHHFFRNSFHSINHPLNPAFPDQVPPFPPYLGRRELSPSGMYSNFGPSFHKCDSVGDPPPHGGLHPHDDRSHFMHRIHRPGMPPHMSERKPWDHQGLVEVGGPVGFPDFAGPPHRRVSDFGGANQSAIITSTTVEVVVPHSLVPIIQGEDGACLKQIRQISDAKINITEPKPGATETVIIISGTPEQTQAAQSLIQAFVMSETEST